MEIFDACLLACLCLLGWWTGGALDYWTDGGKAGSGRSQDFFSMVQVPRAYLKLRYLGRNLHFFMYYCVALCCIYRYYSIGMQNARAQDE